MNRKKPLKIWIFLILMVILSTFTMNTVSIAADIPKTGTSKSFLPSKKHPYSKIKEKIEKHNNINEDVVGWLKIPGTNIDEPILFTDENNTYYEKRDWQGINYPDNNYKNYKITATFADYRTKFGETWKSTSRNTVLYGHNWTNLRDPLDIGNKDKHKMFAQLPSYVDKKFASEHPYIYYSTGENEGIWKVFAVAYCELNKNFFYNRPNPSKEAFQELIDEWKDRTMFDFNVDVDTSDRLLTLSTCTRAYNMGNQQRFVVVARLLRPGESEKDTVKVTVNKDMKQPQFTKAA